MKQIFFCLLILYLFGSSVTVHAQSCDPWIVLLYKQLYGRAPVGGDCDIRNYNNGSWNSYDQLKGFVRKYNSSFSPSQLAKPVAEGKCSNNSYQGICAIAEFVNEDFPVHETTCGQAAAVTAMWHAGLNEKFSSAAALVKSFYNNAPPKITIGGLVEKKNDLGTDWRQINFGLDKYQSQGIRYNWQKGRSALQNELKKGNPCLIMIDTGTLPQFNYKWGGHWVVAYGYDNTYVYVTNFDNNKMSWDQLHKAWGGSLTEGHLARAHGTPEMFAPVWKQ